MHVDQSGLIVQADLDGGDTAQRMGMWNYLQGFRTRLGMAPMEVDHAPCGAHQAWGLLKSSDEPLKFQRYPGSIATHGFWCDPAEFSRDQERPNMICMGGENAQDLLKAVFKSHLGRFGRYQNADWPNPSNIGEYVRARKLVLFYPLLFLCDLFLVLGSLIAVGWIPQIDPSNGWFVFPRINDVDDNNFFVTLCQAYESLPTPFSFLARWLYAKRRPINNGNLILGEKNPIMGAFAWYHSVSSGGNPEFVELVRPIVAKCFWGA